nr:hypothetical protein [Tanacetum cinerariifolium]
DDDVAWWVDYGATVHVCKDRCWFKTYKSPTDGSILHMENESTTLVHGRGCVNLNFSSGKVISLLNVLHVPNIRKNLVSSSILSLQHGGRSVNTQVVLPMMESISSLIAFFQTATSWDFIASSNVFRVYKGQLKSSSCEPDTDVAVKMLDVIYGQGEHKFGTEILLLNSYKHNNIVSLVVFCDEEGKKAHIYKFEVHGILDRHLANTDLTWEQRLQICLGAAHGLEYLHGHFGLAKLGLTNQEISYMYTNIVVTRGYADPQYDRTDKLTIESDVFSFGVVMLEVLSGRPGFVNYQNERSFLYAWGKSCYEAGELDKLVGTSLLHQMFLGAACQSLACIRLCLQGQSFLHASSIGRGPDFCAIRTSYVSRDCYSLPYEETATPYLLRRHYSLVIASGPEVAFVTPTVPADRSNMEWFCLRNFRK